MYLLCLWIWYCTLPSNLHYVPLLHLNLTYFSLKTKRWKGHFLLPVNCLLICSGITALETLWVLRKLSLDVPLSLNIVFLSLLRDLHLFSFLLRRGKYSAHLCLITYLGTLALKNVQDSLQVSENPNLSSGQCIYIYIYRPFSNVILYAQCLFVYLM